MGEDGLEMEAKPKRDRAGGAGGTNGYVDMACSRLVCMICWPRSGWGTFWGRSRSSELGPESVDGKNDAGVQVWRLWRQRLAAGVELRMEKEPM